MTFLYRNGNTPDDYVCHACKRGGVKLWRETNCFGPGLFCVECTNARKGTQIEPDERGQVPCEHFDRQTDHFNGLVPAVPTEDGIGFWGFTSVPDDGDAWWRALPLRQQKEGQ